MNEWLKISLLLCVFGFLRDNRPSEPFVTEYLLHEYPGNVTSEQVNKDVYPVGTYSYAAQLVIVFLITDFLRYKPLIIVIGICGIIVWSLLLWTASLMWLQILEFFYGTYMAAEVAYYTYIYAKVDKKYYPKVTSHTRAAMLCGKLFASILSQLLINFHLMTYKDLNYITLASQMCATLWAFFLPSVQSSLYFHRKENSMAENLQDVNVQQVNESRNNLRYSAFRLLWSHFYNSYTQIKVLQWSIWYALGLCGHLQIASYIQVLWADIEKGPHIAWNGAVDAVLTFLGAIFALLAGYLHTGRSKHQGSLLILAILSILEGLAILLGTWTYNLYLSYLGYIIFGALFAFTITIVSAEIAIYLQEDSYGLVFGINTLFATILQSILTLAVISNSGFRLSVLNQYVVYAFYFIIIGLLYFSFFIIEHFYKKYSNSRNSIKL